MKISSLFHPAILSAATRGRGLAPLSLTTVALVAASLLVGACGSNSPSDSFSAAGTRSAGQEAVTVTLMTVRASTNDTRHTFPAQVEGDRRVTVTTTMMARIDHIAAEEGDRVQEGDILVELDRSALTAEKTQAEAMLRQAGTALTAASNQLNRFRALQERGSATARELEEVETMHEQALAAVAAAESAVAAVDQQLTYAVIKSPITGHVVARYADVGATASPGQPILEVETISDLRVVALVPESRVSQLSEGSLVEIDIDALRSRLTGRIRSINESASAPARQFRVEIDRLTAMADSEADNLEGRAPGDASDRLAPLESLKPGMFARVYIELPIETGRAIGAPRILIPEEALVRRGQLTGVWVVTGSDRATDADGEPNSGRALLRWVRVGARIHVSTDSLAHDDRTDQIEILSGLRAGEKIVLTADGRLTDGQEVREQ